jgi:hypothetical protein
MAPSDALCIVDASHDLDAPDDVQSAAVVTRPPLINPGFARGMNHGAHLAIEKKAVELLSFVNNDTILPRDFRSRVIDDFNADDRIAIVGPKIVHLDDPDIVWSAGGSISSIVMKCVQEHNGAHAGSLYGLFDTHFVSGALLTMRTSVFRELGGWPDAYLFGGEEWELSVIAERAGYRLVIDADLTVLHEAEVTRGQGQSHSFDDLRFVVNSYLNRILFARRVFGAARCRLFKATLLFHVLLRLPFSWKSIGPAQSFSHKVRISLALASTVLQWDEERVDSFQELQRLASDIERKSVS